MNALVTSATTTSALAEDAARAIHEKARKRKIFMIGLAVRLLGVALIWLGEGRPSVFGKALVVVGVVLSVGGIAVLRYLLISGFRRKK